MLREINVEVPKRIAEYFRNSKIIRVLNWLRLFPMPILNREDLMRVPKTNPIGEYAQSCLEKRKAI